MSRFLEKNFALKKSHSEIFDPQIFLRYTKTGHQIFIILQIFEYCENLSHLEWREKEGNGFLVLFRNLALFREQVS